MMMNPNILNKNPLMFFDRAVNAQRSQLLTVMADAVSECRTAADQAAELNETGQVGLLRLAEVWSAIRAKEGMGGLVLEGTEAKILSDVVAQFYAYLSGCMFNDPVGMAIYAELHYMMSSLMLGKNTMKPVDKFSIQYSELLEYIYPVTQEYFPDFDYDEETGQAYMLPSQTPDTFKGRYNRGILKGKFSIDAYMQNRELQDLLTTLDLDAEKFWYLLLFCYDCSWGKCMEGIEIKESPKEQIEKLVNAISEDYKRDTPFGAVFKSPICITLKIGRKNIVIDNKTAIASIAKFCADGLETVKSDQMNTSHVDLSDPHTESFSVFAYYFSQMIITALNYQEQVKEKRKKGANMSDKEKTLISHLLYFTGIVSNESVLVDYDYLKSLLKQYKDKDIRSLNAFYY